MVDDLVRQEWQDRASVIHTYLSAYDVLRMNGITLSFAGDNREDQISCPFHGKDSKPSARIYPATSSKPSHVWCFVCQEKGWDAIGLWRKFAGGMSFPAALSAIERAYGIEVDTSFRAKQRSLQKALEAPEPVKGGEEDFQKLYCTCESRLRTALVAYRYNKDMVGFLAAGDALDRVRYLVEQGSMTTEKGIEIYQLLLARLGETIRKCPVG